MIPARLVQVVTLVQRVREETIRRRAAQDPAEQTAIEVTFPFLTGRWAVSWTDLAAYEDLLVERLIAGRQPCNIPAPEAIPDEKSIIGREARTPPRPGTARSREASEAALPAAKRRSNLQQILLARSESGRKMISIPCEP